MDKKLKIGDIRYFGDEYLSGSEKFAPGVVIGYRNRAINSNVKVECYVIIFYDGHIRSLPIETTEVKISRGLDPVIRDLLTELCTSYIKRENVEREYKLEDIHFKTLCGNALSSANKFEEKWGW